jgi:hypothetical protein
MAFFFPVAGPSLNLALTKLANRTVINSTIASTCNREGGVGCYKSEAPADAPTPAWASVINGARHSVFDLNAANRLGRKHRSRGALSQWTTIS